jgi:hypothetical protein
MSDLIEGNDCRSLGRELVAFVMIFKRPPRAPAERVASMQFPSISCEKCAGPTAFTTEIAPLGSEPGHRMFFCAACKHHTWTTWRNSQQQQQQPQAKPGSKETVELLIGRTPSRSSNRTPLVAAPHRFQQGRNAVAKPTSGAVLLHQSNRRPDFRRLSVLEALPADGFPSTFLPLPWNLVAAATAAIPISR